MAVFLLLTDAEPAEVFPALRVAGLDHKVEPLALTPARVAKIAPTAVLVDAVTDPDAGFAVLLDLRTGAPSVPRVALVAAVDLEGRDWVGCADELLTPEVSAAEFRVRMDLLRRRSSGADDGQIRLGPLVLDTIRFRAALGGGPLVLTFKEFELLRFLASEPGRVFTREELLREVWGYDFYGGTRTVDVHVRRLRAKLGPADEHLIETVRGVGYRAQEPLL